MVTKPRRGQGGAGDSASKEEMGHGEGQSKLRSRKRLSCKNYCKRRILAREPGCARVCVWGGKLLGSSLRGGCLGSRSPLGLLGKEGT